MITMENCLDNIIKNDFGVDVGKHSYGMDFSNIAQGTKIGAFCSIASGVKLD